MESRKSSMKTLERSCLPAQTGSQLHLDGREFHPPAGPVDLDGALLETLAEAAHEFFRAGMRARSRSAGNAALEIHRALVPYAELPEDLKEQNRQNVLDIPAKLAAAGYAVIPVRSSEPRFEFCEEGLERLAEAEHERWMHCKLEAGWLYAARTDLGRKLHDCLVPWERLPDSERAKDRDLVRAIPGILARAGYGIVKEYE